MSVKESKRKLLHYRKASFMKPTGNTLQELLEQALAKLTPVSRRFELMGSEEDEAWRRFINTHRSALGMEFGNLVLYAPDQARHTIAIDDSADELDIEQIAPGATEDGKKRQFLESILYYGIRGNHVILLQSIALKARDLEIHFNWLLRQAGLLDDQNAVFLNNFVPQPAQEKLSRAEVKSVRLGTPLVDMPGRSESTEYSPQGFEVKTTKFRPWGEGFDILRLIAPERMRGLSVEDLQAATDLEVFVEVTYRRQADEKSKKLLNRLTTALRHVGDDDLRIEFKGGVMIGSELQVKALKSIVTYNGLVDPQDVFLAMQSWLLEILDQRLVDAE